MAAQEVRREGKSRLVYDKATRSIIAVGKGSLMPSLQRMLTALYQAEVDFSIASAWDAGFRLAIHKPRSEGWTDRSFTVGKGAHDFPDWTACWDAAVLFICETVVRDWDNLEDGAPVDIGCLDCTLNTTPVNMTTGLCVYHIARHVLQTHVPASEDEPK